jgi:signal transduction histidine kinase
MNLHGGSVKAESKPGVGTTVTLKFVGEGQTTASDHLHTDLQRQI